MDFVQTAVLSFDGETTVKFAENVELTCSTSNGTWFNITNVKGDFDITKVSINFHDGSKYENRYDKKRNGFESYNQFCLPGSWYLTCNATFYITIPELKEICAVTYQLSVPSTHLECLEPYHFFKDEFVLPGYSDLKFTWYVTRLRNRKIEIHVVNPYDVKIHGKKGDFKVEERSDVDESRPESVIPLQLPTTNESKLLHKIHSNQRFSDVIFVTSNGSKIPSHRCILAEFSNIFAKIFEETSELPVTINVEDFDADTIQCALNFMYYKNDAINGKEKDVFKFAVKYGIQDLIDARCSFFEESVSPTNVCDYIQIAYSNDFADLKQKCLKLLVEKKKEINIAQVADLPKNILFDAYCF